MCSIPISLRITPASYFADICICLYVVLMINDVFYSILLISHLYGISELFANLVLLVCTWNRFFYLSLRSCLCPSVSSWPCMPSLDLSTSTTRYRDGHTRCIVGLAKTQLCMDFATRRCTRVTCLYAHSLDELSLPLDGYPSSSDAPAFVHTNGWVCLTDLWRIYFHWEFGCGIRHTSNARSIMNTMCAEPLYESAIIRPKQLDWPVDWHVAMHLYLGQRRTHRLHTGFLPRMVTYQEFQKGQRGTVSDCGYAVSNTVFGARAPVPRRAPDPARAVHVAPVSALQWLDADCSVVSENEALPSV